MNHSARWDRLIASEAKENALRYREQAHYYLRTGYRYGHRTYLHDAIREWKRFRYYMARASQ